LKEPGISGLEKPGVDSPLDGPNAEFDTVSATIRLLTNRYSL
jgi:hypothetical protein